MTAYALRISDWGSDVCSSDLRGGRHAGRIQTGDHRAIGAQHARVFVGDDAAIGSDVAGHDRHRVEPTLLDAAECFGWLVGPGAKPPSVRAYAQMEIVGAISATEAVESLESAPQVSRLDFPTTGKLLGSAGP